MVHSIASRYQYSQLQHRDFRVLLLKGKVNSIIECELLTLNLDTTLSYVALSYTWGDRTALSEITLDGRKVSILRNLAQALSRVFENGHDLVWADAICINQSDVHERNAQVATMGDIFQKAYGVLVWLEGFSERDAVPSAFFKHFCHRERAVPFLEKQQEFQEFMDDTTSVELLQAMLSCEYWTRAWIIQEICMASQVRILVADFKVDWSRIELLSRFLFSLEGYEDSTYFRNFLRACVASRKSTEGVGCLLKIRQLRWQKGSGLLTVLDLFVGTSQQDIRDAVYAKLGMASDSRDIVTSLDYNKNPRAVFVDLVAGYIRAKKSFNIICSPCAGVAAKLQPPESAAFGLPTWVPRWTLKTDVVAIYGFPPKSSPQLLFQAGGRTEAMGHISRSPEGEVLTVIGFVHDHILPAGRPAMDEVLPSRYLKPFDVVQIVCRTSVADHYFTSGLMGAKPIYAQAVLSFLRLMRAYYEQNNLNQVMDTIGIRSLSRGNQMIQQLLQNANYLNIKGRPLSQRSAMCDYQHVTYSTDHDLKGLVMSIVNIMHERILAQGSEGRVYLVPSYTIAGDAICVLQGCALPMVLRHAAGSDFYTVVGSCYVDGIMQGQAMADYLTHSSLKEFHLI